MILLLFGAPGSGKGTQSAKLVERAGFFQISTGDLLRSSIRESTKLGIEAKGFMDRGELVPDSLVIGLVEEVLKKQLGLGVGSFIFDGFPRTLAQAESLSAMLGRFGLKADCAVFINVDRSGLVARLTGRRVCPSCAAVYHIVTSPSRTEGVCDKCGTTLSHRSDDKEEVILSRLDVYESVAGTLKGYYRSLGVVKEVNGDQSVETVYRSIVSSAKIIES